jgi:hypothetical protein
MAVMMAARMVARLAGPRPVRLVAASSLSWRVGSPNRRRRSPFHLRIGRVQDLEAAVQQKTRPGERYDRGGAHADLKSGSFPHQL